jgi:polyphosphate glucokinase
MRRFPLRHPGRDFLVVLGELAKLPEDVLLRRTGRFGDERRSPEELPRRISPALHLQDPSHLTILSDVQGDEHDHPPGQNPTEREKVWAHDTKVPPTRAQRKHFDRYALRRREGAVILPGVKILVIDVGGSHVKLLATGKRTPIKVPSGPRLTPRQMVAEVREATEGWDFEAVSIGYPGPVARNRPTLEPVNLGDGWTSFDYRRAFGRPVRMINDAAMQALGSYSGRTMLFLGLGTGLGTTLVTNGVVVPLELAHLPFENGKSYEDAIGEAGLKRLGKRRWRRTVATIVELLMAATNADYTVLGGGNVRFMDALPANTRRGNNANAFRGGFRLWDDKSSSKRRS